MFHRLHPVHLKWSTKEYTPTQAKLLAVFEDHFIYLGKHHGMEIVRYANINTMEFPQISSKPAITVNMKPDLCLASITIRDPYELTVDLKKAHNVFLGLNPITKTNKLHQFKGITMSEPILSSHYREMHGCATRIHALGSHCEPALHALKLDAKSHLNKNMLTQHEYDLFIVLVNELIDTFKTKGTS